MDIVPQHPQGIEKELSRRDFTINTITYSFSEEKILDPFKGLQDLKDHVVRMLSAEVLEEDPLRMFRAVRFTTTLQGFHLSHETIDTIRSMPERLSDPAAERVREEMDRIMVSGRAREGLELMEDLGLLQVILSELLSLCSLDQGPHHHLDAFRHTLQAVQEVDDMESLKKPFKYAFKLDAEDQLVLSYAALLHDIGKAEDRTEDEAGHAHFYGHEKTGADMAGRIMKRLTFPNRRAERIKHLIRNHVSGLGLVQHGYTPKALRRVLRRFEKDLPLHVLLFMADRRAAQGQAYPDKEQKTITLGQALLDLFREEGESILHLPHLIGGEDVMKVLGILQGPAVGEILDQVRSLQVDQEICTREEALQYLQKLLDVNGS
jgi:poly(A) polymerase